MTDKNRYSRNPAIELYRVVLMFLIVLHHVACLGHFKAEDMTWAIPYHLITVFVIWHVDGFISITGWFGTRFSFVRFAKVGGVIASPPAKLILPWLAKMDKRLGLD